MRFLATLPLLLSLVGTTVFAAESEPATTVRQMVDEVYAVLNEPALDHDTRHTRVEETVRRYFDFRAMAQGALGSEWRKASPAQRERFQALFEQLLRNTYLNRVDAYSNEKVEFGRTRLRDKRAEVATVILSGGDRIPVNYRLYRKGERWMVYDVVIENVSLINSYRTNYRAVIRKKGLDGLLEEMEQLAFRQRG